MERTSGLPIKDTTRQVLYRLRELESYQAKYMRGGWFDRRPAADVVLYLKAVADAKADLWSAVYREYPDLLGSSSGDCINRQFNVDRWRSPSRMGAPAGATVGRGAG